MKYILATALLFIPVLVSAQTAGFCNLDCAAGYAASGPAGSCSQTCVPAGSTPTNTTPTYTAPTYTAPTYTAPSYSYPTTSYPNVNYYSSTSSGYAGACVTLSRGLSIGTSGSDVTGLQQFLVAQGELSATPTGYFGSLTAAAVSRFQQSQGISQTGTVGPLTRAAISRASCGGSAGTNVTTPQLQILSPAQGVLGTTVTLNGSGFINDNAIYFNGSPVTRGGSLSGTTLTFVVPSDTTPPCSGDYCSNLIQQIIPGQYPVYVENTNGTSNTLYFTVTAQNSANYLPVITSVSNPGTLYAGQTGTWTVYVSTPNLSQVGYNLQVAVHWGDEQLTGTSAVGEATSQNTSATTAAVTFTHAYALPGPYTQTFTVTDPSGHSASYVATAYVY